MQGIPRTSLGSGPRWPEVIKVEGQIVAAQTALDRLRVTERKNEKSEKTVGPATRQEQYRIMTSQSR